MPGATSSFLLLVAMAGLQPIYLFDLAGEPEHDDGLFRRVRLTRHRQAQGMTLTRAELQLDNVFEVGHPFCLDSQNVSLGGLSTQSGSRYRRTEVFVRPYETVRVVAKPGPSESKGSGSWIRGISGSSGSWGVPSAGSSSWNRSLKDVRTGR